MSNPMHGDESRKGKGRAEKRETRRRRASEGNQAEFAAIDWVCLAALCEVMAYQGGAVRIGKTRDGGAWAFGLYDGDDYATEYVRPNEDFEEALFEIADAWVNGGRAALLKMVADIKQRGT